jgi:hypothetical protein
MISITTCSVFVYYFYIFSIKPDLLKATCFIIQMRIVSFVAASQGEDYKANTLAYNAKRTFLITTLKHLNEWNFC